MSARFNSTSNNRTALPKNYMANLTWAYPDMEMTLDQSQRRKTSISTVSSTAGMSVGQHESSSPTTSLKLTPSRWLASGIRLGLQVDKTFTLPILSNKKSVKRGKESPTRLSSVLLACPKVPLKPIYKNWHSCQSAPWWVWQVYGLFLKSVCHCVMKLQR